MGAEERVERYLQGGRSPRSIDASELTAVCDGPLFRGVSPERVRGLLERSAEMSCQQGSIVLEAGQRQAVVHLLLSGRLALCSDNDASIAVAHIGPGECLGEMALLDAEAPAPAVVALASSRLLLLDPAQLHALIEAEPAAARNVLRILALRSRYRSAHVAASGSGASAGASAPFTDALTGLHNRRWLQEMFLRRIERCERARQPVCFALIDLDRFRSINDNYGRQAGDRVLAQVARVVQRQVRPSDLLARYGGEELAVLLPETELAAGVAALERLRLAIGRAQTALAQRATVRVSVSVGVVPWCEGWSLAELMQAAEETLARAKQAGRNRVVAWERARPQGSGP